MAAGFEDVVEADEVRFDIGVRVGDGIAHAGLRGEVDHDLRAVLLKDAADERLVRQIALDEGEVREICQFTQAVFLQVDVVVVVYGVKADDLRVRDCLLYTSSPHTRRTERGCGTLRPP